MSSDELEVINDDKKEFDDFMSGKSNSFNFATFQRLVVSELSKKNLFGTGAIMGIGRKEINNICNRPDLHPHSVIRLMDFMYHHSGYIRRLVDYYANAAIARFYIDTEILSRSGISKLDTKRFKNDYISFSSTCSRFNFGNRINYIIREMWLHDACFAFVSDDSDDINFYWLPPKYCRITGLLNGNVYSFQISRQFFQDYEDNGLPQDLKAIRDNTENQWIDVPYQNAFCLKYFDNLSYIIPPMFYMVANVLLIDDYKDLAKSKAINDAYKLLVLPVPTKDGKITETNKTLLPYIQTILSVVQENIGIVPYPGEVQSVEFSSTNADDRDKVSDARNWAFAEAGVSEALLSGAKSGSELKQSTTNDSGDLFRIYRMIESWVDLQMKLRGYMSLDYRFVYRLLDMTIFNKDDVVEQELSMAQASIPTIQRLCASLGMTPNAVVGNTLVENKVFADVFGMFKPLQSSFTQSSSATTQTGGRPETSDADLSTSGEITRENDTNNPDNRV